MSEIQYLTGDATAPAGTGPRLIVHVCNDIGAWGSGFVLAISRRWPEPERQFRARHKEAPLQLGSVQFVEVETNLAVANLVGQHGIRRRRGQAPPVRYEAIREGLREVAREALRRGATVHMPRIGCGLAGGEWDVVAGIVQAELVDAGVSVTVYDLAIKDA